MESICVVGTDIATFFLYEPAALQHRAQSPWGWFADYGPDQTNLAALTVPELSDGRLVEIDTATPLWVEDHERLMWIGSDGAYCFRCTTGTLTRDEAAREYPETRERYGSQVIQITQGRLLLDGGYVIPHVPTGHSPFEVTLAVEKHLAAWLELPNGTYEVTPHYLSTEDEEDEPDDEPTIVLTFALHSGGRADARDKPQPMLGSGD